MLITLLGKAGANRKEANYCLEENDLCVLNTCTFKDQKTRISFTHNKPLVI